MAARPFRHFRTRAISTIVFIAGSYLSLLLYVYSLRGGSLDWLHEHVVILAFSVAASVVVALALLLWITLAPTHMISWQMKFSFGMFGLVLVTMLWFYDGGDTPERHGNFNRLGWAFGFAISGLVLESTLALYWYFGFKYVVLVYACAALFFGYRMVVGYREWPQGLSQLRMQNVTTCDISTPLLAWADAVPNGWLNFWAGSSSCPQVSRFAAFSDEGTLTIECSPPHVQKYRTLPHTHRIPVANKSFPAIQSWILAHMSDWIVYPGSPVHLPHVESVLVKCGDEENLLVRNAVRETAIKRVEAWSSKRTKEGACDTKGAKPPVPRTSFRSRPRCLERPNVLVLYMDAVSRRHFLRKFPKTARFLEQMNGSGVARLFQFLRYHAGGAYTNKNTNRLFLGVKERRWRGHDHNLPYREHHAAIWELYRENGYATATVDNSCQDWGVLYTGNTTRVDHQFIAPFCLPEYYPFENPYGNFQGPFSVRRRCLRGKMVHRYALEYVESFWHNYRSVPKFALAWLTEGHEGTGEVVGLMDDDFEQFLRTQVNFDDTIVYLMSDHGLHMGIFFAFHTAQAMLENKLPLLNVIVPERYLAAHPTARTSLEHNQQALIGSYDLFASWRGIIDPDHDRYTPNKFGGIDFMHDKVSYARSCRGAGISWGVCVCN